MKVVNPYITRLTLLSLEDDLKINKLALYPVSKAFTPCLLHSFFYKNVFY